MTLLTPAKKIRAAINYIERKHPICIAGVTARWRIVEDAELKAPMATNGASLFYNPKEIKPWPLGRMIAVVLHETLHVLLGHAFRLQDRDHRLFNIAADCAINGRLLPEFLQLDAAIIEASGGCFPGHGLFKDLPAQASAEEYYQLLLRHQWQLGAGTTGGAQPVRSCPATGIFGTVELNPSSVQGKAAAAEAERNWKNAVALAALGKRCGDQPGWLVEAARQAACLSDEPERKVDWRTQLAQFITATTASGTGQDYARPARRLAYLRDFGAIPVGESAPGKTRGLLLRDTSGSMAVEECDAAIRELGFILEAYPRATVRLLDCDVVIHEHPEEFTGADFPLPERPKIYGRGGTNLTPAFQYAKNYQPDWCVCVSDMAFNYQKLTDPGVPVFFLGVSCGGGEETYGPGARRGIPFGSFAEIQP